MQHPLHSCACDNNFCRAYNHRNNCLIMDVTAVERLVMEVENLSRKASECKDKYEASKLAKVAKEEQMASCSKEIKALLMDKAQSEKAAEAASLKSREVKHKLEQWDKSAKDAKKRMDELVESHAWISREKKFFGVKDSDFDFESKDVEECKKRLKLLKSEQDKLSKKINKKVLTAHDIYSRSTHRLIVKSASNYSHLPLLPYRDHCRLWGCFSKQKMNTTT